MKCCSKCEQKKVLSDFYARLYSKDGHHTICKACTNARIKSYREAHPIATALRKTNWNKRNSKLIKAKRILNKDKIIAGIVAWQRRRRLSDPAFAMVCRLRRRLRSALSLQRVKKSEPSMELCGCTPAELMAHLQKQFKPGMNWNNRHLWHIDHIRPCASFDLLDPEQQRMCFSYKNLQPLWKHENLAKGDKWDCSDKRMTQ